MAPSMSPIFIERALDVRAPSHSAGHDPTDFLHLRDEAAPSTSSASGSGVSGMVIGLSVLLAVAAVGAAIAGWYIIKQRQQLRSMGTIRVLYNIDNLADTDASKAATVAVPSEKPKLDALADEKMFTIDLSDEKPRAIPVALPPVSEETSQVFPPPMLRRKFTRNGARQRLRIVIPAGVAIPDVELVTTATIPAMTPNTGRSSAVSATRTTASLSRRNTARTPRSALSSAVTALSSAAISVVQRREKVEQVYQSNGWAPAAIVYLPKNPRDAGATASTRSPNMARRLARKSTRRVPPTASSIVPSIGHGDERAIIQVT